MSMNFGSDLPESLIQGFLIGKLLIGGLGVVESKRPYFEKRREGEKAGDHEE